MNIEAAIEVYAHHFLKGLKTEYEGDKEALLIIQQFITTGKINAQQDHILKTQLADSLKILGIGIPFVLIPGASVLMPILIKVAAKHNIELMPSGFTDQNSSQGHRS